MLAGETPVPLSDTSAVCIHFIPHAALAGATDIDLLLAANQDDNLQPLNSRGRSSTFNLDGFLTYSPTATGKNYAYLQVHRNGIIETVNSAFFREYKDVVNFPAGTFATEVGSFLERATGMMRALGIAPPASVFVSLLGARGAQLGISQHLELYAEVHAKRFDRDNLLFREVLLNVWEFDTTRILKPLLDERWQAAGLARCFDYDDEGNWKPRRS